MIKQFTKVITSPIFIVVFLISISAIVLQYFNYNQHIQSYSCTYQINYHESTEEYDTEIDYLNNAIDLLDKKDYNYNKSLKYYNDEIKIYEELKVNNVDYTKVYDLTSNVSDRTSYLDSSIGIMIIIGILNIIMIIYLSFTVEFDNSRYIYIYTDKRSTIIIRKITTIIVMFLALFSIYYFLNYLISLKFTSHYMYFLEINKKATFINIGSYLLHYNYFYILYMLLSILFILISIAFLLKKTISTIAGSFIFILVLAVISLINANAFVYCGFSINMELVNYNLGILLRLIIIIPITLSLISMKHFARADL